MRVHVLYENEAWLPPLRSALAARNLPFVEHFVSGGAFDLSQAPEPGVYVNRMSPSAHTRGNGDGVHFIREYLYFLEQSGCRVINGSEAFALEVSKVRQDAALRRAGFLTPRTVSCVGKAALIEAGLRFPLPFITKHNMGGKGLGVQLFQDRDSFADYVNGPTFEAPFDGVTLLQQYIPPREPHITRIELVDGQLVYAMRSSTEDGFELCPADACAVQTIDDEMCPIAGSGKFTLLEGFERDPLVARYAAFCRQHQIDLAGIEFVEDANGQRYTYDINANTNFNSDVEAAAGVDGMGFVAALCERELARMGEAQAAK